MLQLDKNLWTFYIKKFNAYMYVKQDENDYMRWNFYDSNHNFVDCLYGEIFELNEFVDKARNIERIYDLVDLGLSLNMMYASSLEDLYQSWLDYINDWCYTKDELIENELTYEEFLEELPINKVGQYYFIVNYTEV
jgi:hypothetical protein